MPKRQVDYGRRLQEQLADLQSKDAEAHIHDTDTRHSFEQKLVKEFCNIMGKDYDALKICAMNIEKIPDVVKDAKGNNKKLTKRQRSELTRIQDALRELRNEDFEEDIDDSEARVELKNDI